MESKQAGVDYVADMLRDYASGMMGEEEEKKFFTLYHIYKGDKKYQEEIRRLVDGAFIRYRETALGREIAHLLYGQLLVGSVSRLRVCPFPAIRTFFERKGGIRV